MKRTAGAGGLRSCRPMRSSLWSNERRDLMLSDLLYGDNVGVDAILIFISREKSLRGP